MHTAVLSQLYNMYITLYVYDLNELFSAISAVLLGVFSSYLICNSIY